VLGVLKLPPQALDLLPPPRVLVLDLVRRRRPPPPRHCHESKKAYRGPRIHNAPRRKALSEYKHFWWRSGASTHRSTRWTAFSTFASSRGRRTRAAMIVVP